MQNEINGNAIKVEFSFVSLPLKAITTLSKIDAPKTNNISDGEEDRLKRHREGMPLTLGSWSGTLYILLLCFLIVLYFLMNQLLPVGSLLPHQEGDPLYKGMVLLDDCQILLYVVVQILQRIVEQNHLIDVMIHIRGGGPHLWAEVHLH